ncbi:RING finger protein 10 [Cryptosporidium felis]|nr:RING finger protein 10 [Cryptosporidium felis]
MNLVPSNEPFATLNKYKFIRQNYRIFLKKTDVNNNISVPSNEKIAFKWENVGLVDLIYFDCDEFIKCPICLESDLLVPKISSCGHIYCWPCIVKFMNIVLEANENTNKFKCPICFSNVFLSELVSLRYQIVRRARIGSKINFCLLFRHISSSLISFETRFEHLEGRAFLDRSEKGAQFQRIGFISNQTQEQLRDLQMLVTRQYEYEKDNLLDEVHYIKECISIIENILISQGVKIPNFENCTSDNFSCLLSHYNDNQLMDELENNYTHPFASNNNQGDKKNFFYFYQSSDGQLLFLEPFYIKVLQKEFGTIEDIPRVLSNVSITYMREFALDYQTTRKYKFLSHIPMGSTISIVGIDISPLISEETKDFFTEDLERRLKNNSKEHGNIDDLTGIKINGEGNPSNETLNNSLGKDNSNHSNCPTILSSSKINFPTLSNDRIFNSSNTLLDGPGCSKKKHWERSSEDLFPRLTGASTTERPHRRDVWHRRENKCVDRDSNPGVHAYTRS